MNSKILRTENDGVVKFADRLSGETLVTMTNRYGLYTFDTPGLHGVSLHTIKLAILALELAAREAAS